MIFLTRKYIEILYSKLWMGSFLFETVFFLDKFANIFHCCSLALSIQIRRKKFKHLVFSLKIYALKIVEGRRVVVGNFDTALSSSFFVFLRFLLLLFCEQIYSNYFNVKTCHFLRSHCSSENGEFFFHVLEIIFYLLFWSVFLIMLKRLDL